MAGRTRINNTKLPRKKVIQEEIQEEVQGLGMLREGLSISFVGISIFLFLSLFSFLSGPQEQTSAPSTNLMGKLGYLLASRSYDYLGYCSFSLVGITVLLSVIAWRNSSENKINSHRILFISGFILVLILSFAVLASTLLGYEGGGYLGFVISIKLDGILNKAGTILLSLAAIAISLVAIVDLRVKHYIKAAMMVWSGAQRTAKESTTVIKRGMSLGGAVFEKAPGILGGRSKGHVDDEEEDFVLDSKPRRARKVKKTKISVEEEFELGEEEDEEDDEDEENEIEVEEEDEEEDSPPLISRGEKRSPKAKRAITSKKKPSDGDDPKEREKKRTNTNSTRDYNDYQLPPREILVGLEGASLDGPKDDELIENSKKLEQALRNFKLGGRVVEVHPGPIVTLYQFEPAAGIKVQRIINLADDLALALKVESVRVYAPVPGKGTIGIEVPNAVREIVRLRDIVDSEDYQTKNFALSLALGKDTYGNAFIADLAKMPHLLIAGATGTGKSVCINSLLMSLLYKSSPQDLRLILIDPKMLELSIYEGIPHLLSPVITNPKRAKGVLYWAVEEMDRRYNLMKDLGVRDVSMYNRMIEKDGEGDTLEPKRKKKDELIKLEEKDVVSTTAAKALVERDMSEDADERLAYAGLSPMPRIVIVVDELADLMLTVGKEIEELLTRLAQKARASGIHLILATQRPSVNVITGLIKANFPARISFKVTSKIDARTILDISGSERLLGQGDMLFLSPVIGRMKRLHSPFVSDQEVHDVVHWIREQGEPDYDPRIEKTLNLLEEQEKAQNNPTEGYGMDGEEYDALYDQAVNLVLEKGQASTSMVQRVFRIGYNRAARILEVMEREGVVGPADGAKPREVLVGSGQDLI